MARTRWLSILVVFVIGCLAGAGALIASVEVNRATSTDPFCTSCHSMQFVAADPVFAHAAHQTNAAGVKPGCADCHIPKGNWFVETWAHARSGARDMWAEYIHDFSDPEAWEARRIALAHEVRDAMQAEDSAACPAKNAEVRTAQLRLRACSSASDWSMSGNADQSVTGALVLWGSDPKVSFHPHFSVSKVIAGERRITGAVVSRQASEKSLQERSCRPRVATRREPQ